MENTVDMRKQATTESILSSVKSAVARDFDGVVDRASSVF